MPQKVCSLDQKRHISKQENPDEGDTIEGDRQLLLALAGDWLAATGPAKGGPHGGSADLIGKTLLLSPASYKNRLFEIVPKK
jgi:hypothetical protein